MWLLFVLFAFVLFLLFFQLFSKSSPLDKFVPTFLLNGEQSTSECFTHTHTRVCVCVCVCACVWLITKTFQCIIKIGILYISYGLNIIILGIMIS